MSGTQTILLCGAILLLIWSTGWWAWARPLVEFSNFIGDHVAINRPRRPIVRQLWLMFVPVLAWFLWPFVCYRHFYRPLRAENGCPPLGPWRFLNWCRLCWVEGAAAYLPEFQEDEEAARWAVRGVEDLRARICPWLEPGGIEPDGSIRPPRWS